MKKILAIILTAGLILVVVILFKLTLPGSSSTPVAPASNEPQSSVKDEKWVVENNTPNEYTYVLDHRVEVSFDDEYKNIIYSESGMAMGFANATEDYDVLNSKGETAHGKKGQDVSNQLPNTNANMELRFKAQKKGHKGKITVNIFRYVLKGTGSKEVTESKITNI